MRVARALSGKGQNQQVLLWRQRAVRHHGSVVAEAFLQATGTEAGPSKQVRTEGPQSAPGIDDKDLFII